MTAALELDFAKAADYSDRHRPSALIALQDGKLRFERYAGEFDQRKPHALYSGTKSFWGAAALAASEDGFLDLDEPVSKTFVAWRIGNKGKVKLRNLLALNAGIGFGGLGAAAPTYERALAVELNAVPGERFTYGGIPLQIFGAVLAEKLRGWGITPQGYLFKRVLDPLDVTVARWRTLSDGTQPLPTGAFLTAPQWAKFGTMVANDGKAGEKTILKRSSIDEMLTGTEANPRYGLCWWLSPIPAHPDIAYASGAAGQALYVLRRDRVVIVRFGEGGSFKHETFLKRLLGIGPRGRAAAAG